MSKRSSASSKKSSPLSATASTINRSLLSDPAKKKENPNDEITRIKKIKLSDKGSVRHAIFLNPEGKEHTKRRMDGGHMKSQIAADWMLSKKGAGDVVVELKGRDVARAIEQVCATAKFAIENDLARGSIAALILCTQHPGINTKMQRLMQAFATQYRGPLHARNRSGEFVFEHVLSFNGPDRL